MNRKETTSWLSGMCKNLLQYLLPRASNDTMLAFDFFDTRGTLTWPPSERQALSLGFFDGISGLDRTSARVRLGVKGLMESAYRSTLLNVAWQFRPTNRRLTTQRAAYLREQSENTNQDELPLRRGFGGEWVARTDTNYRGAQFGGSVRRLRDEGVLTRCQTAPFAAQIRKRYRGMAWRGGGYRHQAVQWYRLLMTAGDGGTIWSGRLCRPSLGSLSITGIDAVAGELGQAVQFQDFLQGVKAGCCRSGLSI